MGLGFAGPRPEHEALTAAEPLADLAAVAIERALAVSLGSERAEWFDRLAHTDPLTGLANRRTLDRALELEVARAGRQGVPLSIAIFEIDRFTEIQEAGGNAAGDEALRRVAQMLAESVRLIDTVARFSNDQFILVAPGPDGLVVAERLVQRHRGATPGRWKGHLRICGDCQLSAGRSHAGRVARGRGQGHARREPGRRRQSRGSTGRGRVGPSRDGGPRPKEESVARRCLGQSENVPLTIVGAVGFVTLPFGSLQTKRPQARRSGHVVHFQVADARVVYGERTNLGRTAGRRC